jgi:hypothetical protein
MPAPAGAASAALPRHDAVVKLLWPAIINIEDKRARERAARRAETGKRHDQPARLIEGQRACAGAKPSMNSPSPTQAESGNDGKTTQLNDLYTPEVTSSRRCARQSRSCTRLRPGRYWQGEPAPRSAPLDGMAPVLAPPHVQPAGLLVRWGCYWRAMCMRSSASGSWMSSPLTSMVTLWMVPVNLNGLV